MFQTVQLCSLLLRVHRANRVPSGSAFKDSVIKVQRVGTCLEPGFVSVLLRGRFRELFGFTCGRFGVLRVLSGYKLRWLFNSDTFLT